MVLIHLLVMGLMGMVVTGTATDRANSMIAISGGKFVCRTDLPEWRQYWELYNRCWSERHVESTSVDGDFIHLRQMLYDIVLSNHTKVFECNVGVIAGYSLIGERAWLRGDLQLAYRSYQMAMIFVYTLRFKQTIPTRFELEWRVSRNDIVRSIQHLKSLTHMDTQVASWVSPAYRDQSLRIGIVSMCAYPENHPLILKQITLLNRKGYAAKHGYNAVVSLTHPLGPSSTVDVQHSKLAFMHGLMITDAYDWLMWTDCDSIIVNHARTIDSIIHQHASADTQLLITEELLGMSSANWIIRNSDWSRSFLSRAFDIANSELPLFGDQDAIISLAVGRGSSDPHVTVIPQSEINAYDALNAHYMGSEGYRPGDLLVTFPQCRDVGCNELFQAAYDASHDNGESMASLLAANRTMAQLRVFGPADYLLAANHSTDN